MTDAPLPSLVPLPADTNPLLEYLGVKLVAWEPGRAQFAVDVGERHLNRISKVQGGVIATMMDACCGYSGLWFAGEEKPRHGVTAMLAISYLATAGPGRLVATGTVTRSGRSLFFASGEVRDQDGTLIATAQGTFKAFRPEEKA